MKMPGTAAVERMWFSLASFLTVSACFSRRCCCSIALQCSVYYRQYSACSADAMATCDRYALRCLMLRMCFRIQ